MRSNQCLALVVVLLLGFARSAAAEALPDERGRFDVGETRADLRDVARDRSMGLLVLYPIQESGACPGVRPLILFNHGFLLSSTGYRSYGEHLASHGFVVALPTFPMSFFNVHHAKLAQDVRFVIDYLLTSNGKAGDPLEGRIDPDRIGASGHSLGGKLSLLEAVTDDRIRSIGVLDPVDAGNPLWNDPKRYPSVAPELMPQLDVPLLFIGAELGSILITFSPCAPEDENYQRFFEAANGPAIEVTQLDVGHGQYVDPGIRDEADPCARGEVSDAWVRSSSAAYLTAFFLETLTGSEAASIWLEDRLDEDESRGFIRVRRK